MKLYEFTVTDNFNLPESQILEQADIEMLTQASEEGWAEGYTYKQSQEPEFLPTGEKRYHFAVYGELLQGVGEAGSANQKSTSHASSDDVAAQPQAEI